MKKVSYTELSDKRCKVCKKPLKKNLINKNPDADKDYVCDMLAKGKSRKKYDLKDKQRSQIKKYNYVK